MCDNTRLLFQMMIVVKLKWIYLQRFRRSKYLNYRIITVSNKIHKILPNKGNAPLHEFEGKNVGIRFARGEYVVCTNQGKVFFWIKAILYTCLPTCPS